MSRNLYRLTCVLASILVIGAGRPALAADDVVLRWNAAMLQAIRNTGTNPVRAARGLAIVHTCIYDAWAAYDAVAVGTRLGAQLRRPAGEHTVDNKNRALSFAAYRALVDLLPSEKTGVFDPLMSDRQAERRARRSTKGDRAVLGRWAQHGDAARPLESVRAVRIAARWIHDRSEREDVLRVGKRAARCQHRRLGMQAAV